MAQPDGERYADRVVVARDMCRAGGGSRRIGRRHRPLCLQIGAVLPLPLRTRTTSGSGNLTPVALPPPEVSPDAPQIPPLEVEIAV